MRATRTMAAGLVVAGLIAAGCGSDSDSSSSSDTTTPAVSIAPAKDFSLPEPVKLVSLIQDTTNSTGSNAIDDFNDAIKMAIDEINSAGGIGGHPVEFESIDTSPTDTAAATNALNVALEKNPTALLGPVSSTTALALAPRIAEAGIPTIVNTVEPNLAKSASGNQWIFVNRPMNDATGKIAGEFAVNELGAKDVGVLSVNLTFGKQGVEGITAGVNEAGGTIAAERSFGFDATDLTEPVLAMADTKAVIDWGTPNTVALAVRTMAQQGMVDTPHIGPGSVGFPSFVKAVGDNSLLQNTYGAVDCNPQDGSERAQQWAKQFEATTGYGASYAAGEMYDAVYMLRNIIEEKESADPAAIQDGLNTINWDGGVCADTYSNVDNFLVHQTVMAKFEDGVLTTIKQYDDI